MEIQCIYKVIKNLYKSSAKVAWNKTGGKNTSLCITTLSIWTGQDRYAVTSHSNYCALRYLSPTLANFTFMETCRLLGHSIKNSVVEVKIDSGIFYLRLPPWLSSKRGHPHRLFAPETFPPKFAQDQ